MKKVRYEVDPYNRLILDESDAKSGLNAFRQVLDGRFKTDENNNLFYHIKAPLSEKDNKPNQIRLKGEWSLGSGHNLCFTFDKSARETFGDQITLAGQILDANKNSILFAVTTISKDNTQSTYTLNLLGSWKADEFNRLSFHLRREKGKTDILTFNGAWEINRNNQIIYQYDKEELVRKKKEIHTLTFKGYWDIKESCRISYCFGANTESVFNFSTSAGIFKDGYIKYELGIGADSDTALKPQTITLFGQWKIKKNIGLIFEIKCEESKTQTIVFGAETRLTDRDTIICRLKDDMGNNDIGAAVELSHSIIEGDGEEFLRVLKSRGESAVYVGAAWRW